jgi:hypothetical protein
VRLLQGRLLTMNDKAARVALGGVFSALCLLFMFMTAVIPLATFLAPIFAGTALIVVVIENGAKTAFLVYVSVALLSIFIVPDIDAKLLFIAFFGYYAALRPTLERISARWLRRLLKLIIFNAAMSAWLVFTIAMFGMEAVVEQNGAFGEYALPVFYGSLNFMFVFYDFSLSRCVILYTSWFRPRFLRK